MNRQLTKYEQTRLVRWHRTGLIGHLQHTSASQRAPAFQRLTNAARETARGVATHVMLVVVQLLQ
jgi:hypothetical protein